MQCAWTASRKKTSHLQAQFQRLHHRSRLKKEICAVAASILSAVYHMLRDGTFYQDPSASHFCWDSFASRASCLTCQNTIPDFTCTFTRVTEGLVSV